MKSSETLYKFHVANLRFVSNGLNHIFRSARNAIACGNQNLVSTHVRLLLFILGAWSEVRLLKLLHGAERILAEGKEPNSRRYRARSLAAGNKSLFPTTLQHSEGSSSPT